MAIKSVSGLRPLGDVGSVGDDTLLVREVEGAVARLRGLTEALMLLALF